MRLTVKDTGVGIPDSLKPKLFTEFGTFDNKQGLNKQGTGLGLVICKKLVGLLGPTDELNMDSQLGKGTSISFLLNINNSSYVSMSEFSNCLSHQQIIEEERKNLKQIFTSPEIFLLNQNQQMQEKEEELKQNSKTSIVVVNENSEVKQRKKSSSILMPLQ